MAENLLISGVTMMICVVIQCVVVGVLLRLLFALDKGHVLRPTILFSSCVLIMVLMIMLAGNILQITLWAGMFRFYGEFDDFATAFYHSTVNFTTLGYGDLVMSQNHRLLGALEAANGVLMFGLTTSTLFAVMHALMRRGWARREGRASDPRGCLDFQ